MNQNVSVIAAFLSFVVDLRFKKYIILPEKYGEFYGKVVLHWSRTHCLLFVTCIENDPYVCTCFICTTYAYDYVKVNSGVNRDIPTGN